MPVVWYLSHPQVAIDPAKDITKWSLNAKGHARTAALCASGALNGVAQIYASTETKAVETATPLARALDCPLETRFDMGENDRSATGFLPPAEFEATADAFFANPDDSIRGWETARAAQRRIVAAVQACTALHPTEDVLFVGHGAVGTLLYCALRALPISRAYDQGPGGGGCFLRYTQAAPNEISPWQPMEHLMTPGTD